MVFTEKQKIDEALEVIDEMLENAEKEKIRELFMLFENFLM